MDNFSLSNLFQLSFSHLKRTMKGSDLDVVSKLGRSKHLKPMDSLLGKLAVSARLPYRFVAARMAASKSPTAQTIYSPPALIAF